MEQSLDLCGDLCGDLRGVACLAADPARRRADAREQVQANGPQAGVGLDQRPHAAVPHAVTTSAQVSVAAGSATDAIVNGYRVGSPDTPPPAPAAPVAVPAAPMAPVAPTVVPAAAQPLGLPR